jgi:hypothetical protein
MTFWGLTSGQWGLHTGTRDPCTADSDGDNTPDCYDQCPNHPGKTSPGVCGCDRSDVDADGDSTPDCFDRCPNHPGKISPGACGCDQSDVDSDGDLVLDCDELCPTDPSKLSPGICGCGIADSTYRTFYEDADGDGYGNAGSSTNNCGQPAGFATNSFDCNDSDGSIHPSATDTCGDSIDSDCDGDDGCASDWDVVIRDQDDWLIYLNVVRRRTGITLYQGELRYTRGPNEYVGAATAFYMIDSALLEITAWDDYPGYGFISYLFERVGGSGLYGGFQYHDRPTSGNRVLGDIVSGVLD